MEGYKRGVTRKDVDNLKLAHKTRRHEEVKGYVKKAKSEALRKKMKGKGEYSKLSFTPKNESEARGFKKRFQLEE